MTDDVTRGGAGRTPRRTPAATGVVLALVSAVAFGLSGALARPLLDAGWSAGAVVLVRIGLGALVVVPFGVRALRGRWHLVRASAGLIVVYGLLVLVLLLRPQGLFTFGPGRQA